MAISNASRPINSQELKACAARGIRFIELPIAFDALTVAVNPRNSWARTISTEELGRLWNRGAQGRIKRWNQGNSAWPARPITLCGPDKDSGTFDYFNKAVNGNAANSRTDYSSSEDDNVLVNCVASDLQSLGYFGYSYYAANRNRLRALAVEGPKGAVRPSLEAVQKERYLPFSRPLFLYINNEQLLERPELQRFVTAFVRQAPRIVETAGAIPLPESTYRLVETKLYRHVLGSSFSGDLPVGLTVSQALGRSFQQLKRPLPR
ncbi:substrate-binding domain-containing protein [Synechococcus sp. BA-124 BA4]|uniref:substrate-binding domain-containing protein n=1 Tax=unclassified Synechococcus TaxID=2626047 RepID=UPI002AD47F2F|nr:MULTISPECIES: substrate-binding domain-containing protein [unclassified Synechococcus]MEA5398615.1 substrate-binding domain-containing protein [Synechococcus sp. BA-124 BA4]CAK6694625.1 Protein SphX [Synechococcus sp. CBW1107]